MAQADPFPKDALQEIAADIPDWLEASELTSAGVRIASTPLSLWEVRSGSSLDEAATDSGEWHHQLRNAEGAFAFARSRSLGGHAEIVELAESPLAKTIDTILLDHLRDSAEDQTILRLLYSAKHHTTCLWLHKQDAADEVIVLQSQELRTGERLDERAFLAKLAALPVSGMTSTIPRNQRYRDVQLWGSNRAQPPRQPGA
jgi:hypothetical protein